MPQRFVILGGGPAGNSVATTAARLGADVTLIERDVVGGAAHLRDCIPSKAMIATGGAMREMRRATRLGPPSGHAELDFDALRSRIGGIERQLESSVTGLLQSQGVHLKSGTGRMIGPHEVE